MPNVPIVTSVTKAELDALVAANGLNEGLQYKVTDKNWLLVATGANTYKFASIPYKVYTALLTQSGTDAPTAIVLDNTIGDIIITRSGEGTYYFTLAGAFPGGKTVAIIGPGDSGYGGPFYAILDEAELPDAVLLTTALQYTDIVADGCLGNTFFEIRVYDL